MDFLCYNISQINDNVVTVKNYTAHTTTVSDMRIYFKYCSRYERVSNSPESLAYKIINTSNQVVNKNSSETSNLENLTNEVPVQDSNYANKNKKHENFCPQ